MAVKVTGQFEPAGDFSIVDGADVSGHITGSNVSASGQLEAGSLGTNLASIISGSTPFNAAAVSGSLGANASLIRSLTATGISGSTPFDASDVSGSWQGHLSSSRVTFGGDIYADGNVIAQNYIVSSSVTHMTQSFSSGSTIFGDTLDDTHQFTGSLFITGSKISGSSTSTGSFQTIRFGPPGRNFRFYESGNDAYFGGSGLAIGSTIRFRVNAGESLSTGGTDTITRIENISSNTYMSVGGDGGSADTALLINTGNQNYLGLGLRTNAGLNTPNVIKIHDELSRL